MKVKGSGFEAGPGIWVRTHTNQYNQNKFKGYLMDVCRFCLLKREEEEREGDVGKYIYVFFIFCYSFII